MGRRGTLLLALLVLLSGAYLWFDVPPPSEPARTDGSPEAPGLATPGAEPLLAFMLDDVTSVRLSQKGTTREAHRRDGVWEPDRATLLLDGLVRSLVQLPVLHEISASTGDLSQFGLVPPHGTIEIRATGHREPAVLEVGDRNPPGSAVYVRLVDRGRVVLAGALVRHDFDRTFAAMAE